MTPDIPIREPFLLDPAVAFLNHGSFGACPRPVLARAAAIREEIEANPVAFMNRGLPARLAEVKRVLGAFVGADGRDLVFVPNVTTAVNAVARGLRLRPGDEVVASDHDYGACVKALEYACREAGARVVLAPVEIPVTDPAEVVAAYARAIGDRTRLVLASHLTSPTGLVWPVERIVSLADSRGVPILVDGAHGPGQIPVDCARLGADFYAGNCHKWLFSPKGAAFLHVRRDRHAELEPLVVSWGWPPAPGKPRLPQLFDWCGTVDPSPVLAIPAGIAFLREVGGVEGVLARGRALCGVAREALSSIAGMTPVAPADAAWGACMVAFRVPEGAAATLQQDLIGRHGVEVLVTPTYRGAPLLRVSCQVYNAEADIERLAEALRSEVGA